MPMRRDYHIRSQADGWTVTREGAPGRGSVHSTKSEALAAATECAKRDKVELVVHRKAGRVPAAPDPVVPIPSSEECPQ